MRHPDVDFQPRCPRCRYPIKMGDYVRHGMHADCAVERRRVRRQWFEILLFAGLLIMVYGILKLVGWL